MSLSTILVLAGMALFGGFADTFRAVVLRKLGLCTTMGVIYLGFALPFGLGYMIFTGTYPVVTKELVLAHVVALPFIALTVALFYSSLQKTEFSIASSIFGLGPATAMIGDWVLGEAQPSWMGVVGIVTVSLGAYILHLDAFKYGPFTPFKRLWSDRGARHALFAVVALAFAIPFQRQAVMLSESPAFWMIVESSLCVPYLMLGIWRERAQWKVTRRTRIFTISAGCVWSLHAIFLYTGLQLTLGGYVMAVRSLAMIVGFALAYLIMKEKVGSRIPGMLVIIIGTFIVTMFA